MIKKKLVRDKVHEIYKFRETYTADDAEFKRALKERLQDEVDKFMKTDSPEELVDIIEISHALAKTKGMSVEELEQLRVDKADKRGKFDHKTIIKNSVITN